MSPSPVKWISASALTLLAAMGLLQNKVISNTPKVDFVVNGLTSGF